MLTGHITGLTRPFVCLSVQYRLITWKHKSCTKPECMWTFLRAGETGVPISSSEGQRSGLGLGSCSQWYGTLWL